MKKWCTYSWISGDVPEKIGMLLYTSDDKQTGFIKYYPNQQYSPSLWSMRFVRVFDDLKSACEFLLNKNKTGLNKEDIESNLLEDWGEVIKL
jgi:hypothetical protein